MTKTDPDLQVIDNTEEDVSGEAHILFCDQWKEVRKVQGKEKGKAYTVPDNGIIKLSKQYIGKKIRIFVEVGD